MHQSQTKIRLEKKKSAKQNVETMKAGKQKEAGTVNRIGDTKGTELKLLQLKNKKSKTEAKGKQ